MLIDAHVHHYERGFFPDRWLDFVAYKWGERAMPPRDPALVRPRIEAGMEDPGGERLIEHMDASGIDISVLHPLDWELGFGQPAPVGIEQMHERIAGLARRRPRRLIAFAGIDPQRPNAVELFEWAVGDLGMRGLKLYPSTGFYPYDERVFPLYERCEAWGLPVLSHTGDAGIGLLAGRFANPVYLQDVQAAFPKLRLWLAHAGHRVHWRSAAAVAAAGVHTYLELSMWHEMAERDEEGYVRWLAEVRDLVGAHRLIWGSDHIAGARVRGLDSLVKWAAWFRDLPARAGKHGVEFTQEETDLILGGNAARCLGLDDGATRPRVDA